MPGGAISEAIANGLPGGCFLRIDQAPFDDGDGGLGDDIQAGVRRFDGDLGHRIAEGIDDVALLCRCRFDDGFMRLGGLIVQEPRRQMQLLVRQHHRFRVPVGGGVFDSKLLGAVLTHAATLVCGRSPA